VDMPAANADLSFIRRMGHAGRYTHDAVARGLKIKAAADAAERTGCQFMSQGMLAPSGGERKG
jgi:hypothetical protein